MPKKQKRFKSEQAILKAIDAMEERRVYSLQLAEEKEAHLKDQPPSQYKDYIRKLAGAARRSAQRAENKKVELGKALSSHRTMLLPLPNNDDSSVVL